MKPGDVVVGFLEGAVETKVRPAVVIASTTHLKERPDALVGFLATRVPKPPGSPDYALQDWQVAGLRAESHFRAYVLTVHRSELTIPITSSKIKTPASLRSEVIGKSKINDRLRGKHGSR